MGKAYVSDYVDKYQKRYIDDAGNFVYIEIWKNGVERVVDYDQDDFVNWRINNGIAIEEIEYTAPVDTRTNEEKRESEYQLRIDGKIQKLIQYEIEARYTKDQSRKKTIEADIIAPLAAEIIAIKAEIRAKYPGGLWKPTAGGSA